MISDIEVLNSGLEILVKGLGNIDAERFFVMVNKEKMDYTKWRENLCANDTLHNINENATNETIGFENKFNSTNII